jgi:DNA-binding TFAR19-related protein (PDSD5 family)
MTTADVESECVDRIPDVAYVRRELARNVRELLSKLLRLAQRKAAIVELEQEADLPPVGREVFRV